MWLSEVRYHAEEKSMYVGTSIFFWYQSTSWEVDDHLQSTKNVHVFESLEYTGYTNIHYQLRSEM